jgi:hypothetical protein
VRRLDAAFFCFAFPRRARSKRRGVELPPSFLLLSHVAQKTKESGVKLPHSKVLASPLGFG